MPNGVVEPRKLLRCGIEPARRRESNAAFALELDRDRLRPLSVAVVDAGLNGLVDGIGRADLVKKLCCESSTCGAAGENLEGTVPARARLGELISGGGGTRSGNPSWSGDSGMVSRRGVELPLVGGPPHMFGESPSCALISRALIETFISTHRSCAAQVWI